MSLRGPVPKSNKDSHFILNNVALAGMTDSEVKIKKHQVKEDISKTTTTTAITITKQALKSYIKIICHLILDTSNKQ